MTGAAATSLRHTIRAKKFSGDFQNVKTAATLARAGFGGLGFRLRTHALAKLSAIAIAFRIAMDLLTVS